MPKAFTLPYRRCLENPIGGSPWHYRNQEGFVVYLPDILPGWDYNFDIELHRSVSIDTDKIKNECKLPDNFNFLLITVAASPSSRYRECIWKSNTFRDNYEGEIRATIKSSLLSEKLEIITEIVTGSNYRDEDIFAPCTKGNRLYSEIVYVQLEGVGSRFPVEIKDFSKELKHIYSPNACWYLSWQPSNLELPVMREMVIYVNSRQEKFVNALKSNSPNAISMLRFDIVRQLLTVYLDIYDQEDRVNYEDGSVGKVITNLLKICFPSMGRDEIIALKDRNLAEFESRIQSVLAIDS